MHPGVAQLDARDAPPDCLCERCGEGFDMTDANVEAFELCGQLVCPECADEVFEENSQFGAGA